MAYANLAVHAHALKLAQFRFTSVEVLHNKCDQRRRNADILRAVSLDSSLNLPVLMWVEGIDSCVCIQGRILAIGDRIVYLDSELNVPTHSICRIVFN